MTCEWINYRPCSRRAEVRIYPTDGATDEHPRYYCWRHVGPGIRRELETVGACGIGIVTEWEMEG